MGVRHLPVFDERQRLCGIITRKDMVLELPTEYYLLPTLYYLLPTTYYLLPATYHGSTHYRCPS